MSLLVDFVGAPSRTPSNDTRRPSTASPNSAQVMALTSGSAAWPRTIRRPLSTRSSSCPYGWAIDPVTSIRTPRTSAGASDGRRIGRPAAPSWIAASEGVPRRPASAVTIPAIRTRLPTWYVRAAAIEMSVRSFGVAVGVGEVVGVGLGSGLGLGEAVGVGLGSGLGLGVGEGSGEGVGDGVGGGATVISPGSVA